MHENDAICSSALGGGRTERKNKKNQNSNNERGGQVYAMKLTPSLCKLLKIVICQQPWPVCCPMPEA